MSIDLFINAAASYSFEDVYACVTMATVIEAV